MKLSPILQTYKKRLLAAISNDMPQHADPEVQSQLNHMIRRFRGALKFIRKTTINQQGKPMQLKDLPWLLMVGPANSGKTALLANAQVPYILQKNFAPAASQHFEPSEHVDWWATRYAGMIDVPSKYLFDNENEASREQYWHFFLSLIKKQNIKKDISGIAITLPLPEIMRQNNSESFHNMLDTLRQRINEVQATLEKPLPCYLVITKCDLLAGFHEFFADTSDDELAQHWGIMLNPSRDSEPVEQLFDAGFNGLIHKLNQQLLSRLHQERNPIARPYIKNFPLQVERLKAFIAETIQQLNRGSQPLILRGVYLTSALQQKTEVAQPAAKALVSNTQNGLQIFKEPAAKSRSYFIKQFILRGMLPAVESPVAAAPVSKRKQYALYAVSASAIILTAFLLGRDFKIGMEQTYQIQTNLNDYHHVLQQFHNPNESMLKTLALLETLQKSKSAGNRKSFVKKVLTYYSDKSQKNAAIVYHNALSAFLIPEIRNYFADYLVNPINKDAESIYSVFKAYLMLGDISHLNAEYVRMILTGILPKSFGHTKELLFHFDAALENYQPIQLDNTTISNTRKYLLSLRGSQLGNIILKSMDKNTQNSDALLGDNVKTNALFTTSDTIKIPAMFTSKNFVNVFEQEIQIAALEAATGNWILGTGFLLNTKPNYATEVAEEMRSEYVKKYADTWETALANTKIEAPRDLEQADAIIVSMTSYDSPLLRILNNIHENTFFEPVTTASPKLFSIGQLIDRNNTSKQELMQILTHLEALHEYLQPVLSAEDPKKAAYLLINNRMRHQGSIDPITKLRMASDHAPMPLKGWINQLTNDTWRFLLKDAMHYLDTSWNEKVSKRFETHIAHRYPFSDNSVNEVSYQKFIRFFGKPGIITAFYNDYLSTFVDTSKPQWEWKKLNGQDLPFSADGLAKIQQAMNIHQAFFPNDDDKLFVPFALQQKMLAKNIKFITLNINSKIIVDKHSGNGSYYVLNWPYNLDAKYSSVALTMAGNKTSQLDFPGSWGWFKLVSQTFESARSDNQIILNFSQDKYPAKYLLSTIGKQNPFTSLNMNRFNLPEQLTTNQA